MKATRQPFVIGFLASAMILYTLTLTGFAQTSTVGMGPSNAQSLPSFTLTGSMTTARKGHTATLQLDGRVLIVGGNSGSVASAELFDPLTGTFSATGSLSRAVVNHRATLLQNGRTLITDPSGHAELYDPVTGTFTVTGSMIVARVHTATLLLSGKVLFTGNASVSELYDPLTGTFTATGSTLDGSISTGSLQRNDAAILLLDGRVLRTGYFHTEIYDPETGTFSVVGPPPIYNLVQDSTITLLASGSVLFTGGVNPFNDETFTFASGVLYLPETGSFQPTDNMNVSRAFHTATLLPGGAVLITGGFSGGYCCFPDTRSAEIYIPETRKFLPTASMLHERSGHTATLLEDGRVLVAGGGFAAAQISAELYSLGGATLTASPTTIPEGGTLTATWAGIPSPSATDWIGLYQPGAPDTALIDWIYVSCSKTASSPQASGSCPFVLPGNLPPETYQLRLFANNSRTVLATSNDFAVTGGTTLTASPTSIGPGGVLTATWAGIPSPSATDWIGLYQPGAPDTALIDWIYVSCSKTASSPQASGSCPFVLPGNLPPETYQLRLFANNSRTVLATSNDFTVTGGTTLTASPTSIGPGGVLTATWAGIPSPSATDWIGLYQPGAPDTALIDWIYVSCSKTASSPQASGSCPFVLPGNLPPETYQLRLFANNSRTVLATSYSFTVQ